MAIGKSQKSKEAWLASQNVRIDHDDPWGRRDGLNGLGTAITPCKSGTADQIRGVRGGHGDRAGCRSPVRDDGHGRGGTHCAMGWITSITSNTNVLSSSCARRKNATARRKNAARENLTRPRSSRSEQGIEAPSEACETPLTPKSPTHYPIGRAVAMDSSRPSPTPKSPRTPILEMGRPHPLTRRAGSTNQPGWATKAKTRGEPIRLASADLVSSEPVSQPSASPGSTKTKAALSDHREDEVRPVPASQPEIPRLPAGPPLSDLTGSNASLPPSPEAGGQALAQAPQPRQPVAGATANQGESHYVAPSSRSRVGTRHDGADSGHPGGCPTFQHPSK